MPVELDLTRKEEQTPRILKLSVLESMESRGLKL